MGYSLALLDDRTLPISLLHPPEIIRFAVVMHVQFSPSLRNVEDLRHERGIDVSHETLGFWWNRLRLTFAARLQVFFAG
jgi:putative transposase